MQAQKTFEIEAKNNSWSHSYLLIGQNKQKIESLIDFIIEKRECLAADISKLSPEAGIGKSGEIKIDEVRELLHTVSLSPLGKLRIAVIYNCEKLNQSSGNILLKNLEEPARSTMFILVAQSNQILSTIRSRCRVVNVAGESEEAELNEGYIASIKKGFFEASSLIDRVIKSEEIEDFLDQLRIYFRKKMREQKKIEFVRCLEQIEETKKRIGSNANPKLAMEALCVAISKSAEL